MPTISLTLLDFMDADPISSAEISLTYKVVPLFAPRPDPSDPEPDEQEPEPVFGLAEKVERSGRTNRDGMVELTLSTTEAADRAREATTTDGRKPVIVQGWVDVRFELLGARLHWDDLWRQVPITQNLAGTLPVDLGMSIVGHVTPTSALLWFRTTFPPVTGQSFHCIVNTPQVVKGAAVAAGPLIGKPLGREFPVSISGPAHTGVVKVDLPAGASHDYKLMLRRGVLEDEAVIARGRFATPSSDQPSLAFAFGSCHQPAISGTAADPDAETISTLGRWTRLGRAGQEFLLLMGDQIYGDGIERKWPHLPPDQQYNRVYAQLWAHRPTRQVLRNCPTYMALDDHEVADDYGTVNLPDPKVAAAIDAFRIWQHSHNPPAGELPFHYHFRWGPAAFFVLDCRSQRGQGSAKEFPVLGERQFNDLVRWANSAEARTADVIFLVSPVPLAVLPAELLRALVRGLTRAAGVLVGLGAGLLVGGLIGGPVGAAVLGAVGFGAADEVFEEWVEPWLLNEKDLAEAWDLKENQPDLEHLLAVLFALANGTGEDPPRKRAVFILAGDVHVGAVHAIVSLPKAGQANHAANPVIYQLSSSAISHPPLDDGFYRELVEGLSDRNDLAQLIAAAFPEGAPPPGIAEDHLAPWVTTGPGAVPTLVDELAELAIGKGPARFLLDPNEARRYVARYLGLFMERNVGFARVTRLDPTRRRYRFHFAIEGERSQITSSFDLDLDDDQVTPILDDARFLAVRAPTTATRGRPFTVEVDVRNNGAGAWTANHRCQVIAGPWLGQMQPVTGTVSSGSTRTFRFQLKVASPGTFDLAFRMSRRHANFDQIFGDPSPTRTIIVSGTSNEPCAELRDALAAARERLQDLADQAGGMAEPSEELLEQINAKQTEIRGIKQRFDEECT